MLTGPHYFAPTASKLNDACSKMKKERKKEMKKTETEICND